MGQGNTLDIFREIHRISLEIARYCRTLPDIFSNFEASLDIYIDYVSYHKCNDMNDM